VPCSAGCSAGCPGGSADKHRDLAGLLLTVMPVAFNGRVRHARGSTTPTFCAPTDEVLSRLDVGLAGDHLVPEVRDDRRDEREPILALCGGQHPEMAKYPLFAAFSRRPRRPIASRWVYGECSLCLSLRRGDFSRLRHSVGVWA
jgi:hypothetical protein